MCVCVCVHVYLCVDVWMFTPSYSEIYLSYLSSSCCDKILDTQSKLAREKVYFTLHFHFCSSLRETRVGSSKQTSQFRTAGYSTPLTGQSLPAKELQQEKCRMVLDRCETNVLLAFLSSLELTAQE